jgi:hypothetical protein
MRSVFVILAWTAMLGVAYPQTNDWSKRIVSRTKHPFSEFFNPRAGDVNILIIDKDRFEHVIKMIISIPVVFRGRPSAEFNPDETCTTYRSDRKSNLV